jgi:hypothetical protein
MGIILVRELHFWPFNKRTPKKSALRAMGDSVGTSNPEDLLENLTEKDLAAEGSARRRHPRSWNVATEPGALKTRANFD